MNLGLKVMSMHDDKKLIFINMTKNHYKMVNTLKWQTLVQSDNPKILLSDTLRVKTGDLNKCRHDPLAAASLIFNTLRAQGTSETESLEHITSGTLAALTAKKWLSPVSEVQRVQKQLNEQFPIDKLPNLSRYGQVFPKIHYLRMQVYKEATGKSLSNRILADIWDIEFSKFDLMSAISPIFPLDSAAAVLLGVYFGSGVPTKKTGFRLKIGKTNSEFFHNSVVKLIKSTFNKDAEIKTYQKKDTKSYDIHSLLITSTAHRSFIEGYFKHWFDRNTQNYTLPANIIDPQHFNIPKEQVYMNYAAGIIASRGAIVQENDYQILLMISKNNTFLYSIQYIGEKIGLRPSVKRISKKKSYQIRFDKNDMNKMLSSDTDQLNDKIYPSRLGIFINPYHTQLISQFNVHNGKWRF